MGIQNLNAVVNLRATGGIPNSGLPVSQGGAGPNKVGTSVVSLQKAYSSTSVGAGAGGGMSTKPGKHVMTNGTRVANPAPGAVLSQYNVPFPPINNGLYATPPYDGSNSIVTIPTIRNISTTSQTQVSTILPGQSLNALVTPGVIPSIGQGFIKGGKQ